MSKMIIMHGLPASGKSTRAKELIAENGNCVRINKDLLRTMLHFDNFTGPNESKTRDAARKLADWFLANDVNVIIDDTNLNPGTLHGWKDLARIHNAKVEVVRIDTPVEDCLLRDMDREKQVGNTVIKNMALMYGLAPIPKMGYVICDIDGTIADCEHRRHFLDGEKKDWKSFFEAMGEDSVRNEVAQQLVDYYNKMYTVIFVSARPERYKEKTLEWLNTHYLSFAWTLIMRRDNDTRPDTEVKKQILDTYFPDRSLIHKVIDDRPSVIRMWRDAGLDVIDVGNGIEF